MRQITLLSALTVVLLSCTPSGTQVFDETGDRVGRVSVENEDEATIFDETGSRVGFVTEDRVFLSGGTRVGRVSSDDRIFNTSGTRLGRVSGSNCLDREGDQVGRLSSDIDDEAAGGACLLLLLR